MKSVFPVSLLMPQSDMVIEEPGESNSEIASVPCGSFASALIGSQKAPMGLLLLGAWAATREVRPSFNLAEVEVPASGRHDSSFAASKIDFSA